MFADAEIRFDPAKNERNIHERGIPLASGAIVLANQVGEVGDTRHVYKETRKKAFGQIDGRWFECVYTMRGDVAHIISVHRVRQKEIMRWLARS
jgi:uncharacterized DUF497 family protein